MKKSLALLCILAMTFALAACSQPAVTPGGDDNQTPGGTGKVETINGTQVDFASNDIIIVKDYQGQYIDQLEPVEHDLGAGKETYSIAVFGDIVEPGFMIGQMHSEADFFGREGRISNQLITLKNAPDLSGEMVLEFFFMDCSGENYRFDLRPDADNGGLLVIQDSGRSSASVEPGRVLYATYKADGHKFIVEADESQQVQRQPVNYLYLQYDGQTKQLLTQSVDEGDEYWDQSIRNIFSPVLCKINNRVYYETDIESRTSGAGANSYFTHKIDLDTNEDSLFSQGGIYQLLTEEHAPYQGQLILQGWELYEGKLVPNYFLVNDLGLTECYLGLYVDIYDTVYQIDQALGK